MSYKTRTVFSAERDGMKWALKRIYQYYNKERQVYSDQSTLSWRQWAGFKRGLRTLGKAGSLYGLLLSLNIAEEHRHVKRMLEKLAPGDLSSSSQ